MFGGTSPCFVFIFSSCIHSVKFIRLQNTSPLPFAEVLLHLFSSSSVCSMWKTEQLDKLRSQTVMIYCIGCNILIVSCTIHCKDTILKVLKKIFPEKELHNRSHNFYIHVSLSDFYIPTIGLPILLQEYMWTDPGKIKTLTDTWMLKLGLRGHTILFLGIHKWNFGCSVRIPGKWLDAWAGGEGRGWAWAGCWWAGPGGHAPFPASHRINHSFRTVTICVPILG